MGNLSTYKTVYIVGEVDFRVFNFDKPLLHKTNICLRYPTIYENKPISLQVNYEQPINLQYYYVTNPDLIRKDGFELRKKSQTQIVMIECQLFPLIESFLPGQIIQTEIVPMTHSYAMK
jgi:hypothetical protein